MERGNPSNRERECVKDGEIRISVGRAVREGRKRMLLLVSLLPKCVRVNEREEERARDIESVCV